MQKIADDGDDLSTVEKILFPSSLLLFWFACAHRFIPVVCNVFEMKHFWVLFGSARSRFLTTILFYISACYSYCWRYFYTKKFWTVFFFFFTGSLLISKKSQQYSFIPFKTLERKSLVFFTSHSFWKNFMILYLCVKHIKKLYSPILTEIPMMRACWKKKNR